MQDCSQSGDYGTSWTDAWQERNKASSGKENSNAKKINVSHHLCWLVFEEKEGTNGNKKSVFKSNSKKQDRNSPQVPTVIKKWLKDIEKFCQHHATLAS